MFNNSNNSEEKHISFDPSNETHLKIAMGLCFALIIFFFMYGIIHFASNDSYKKIKEYPKSDLVFSTENSTENQNIPYVNIKGFDTVNHNIEAFVGKYVGNSSNTISYDYQVNGIILSVIISAVYEDEDEVPGLSFLSYNINLEEKKTISDDTLINYYGLDKSKINQIVEDNFKDHYNNEIKKGYIVKEECNFSCYLKNRGDYKDKYAYFIEGGKLYAYVPFNAYSVYGEEKYFKDEDFKVFLAEAPEE